MLGQSRVLVEIPEGVKERRGPWIAPARGVRNFRDPNRFLRLEMVTQANVKRIALVRAGEPLFG